MKYYHPRFLFRRYEIMRIVRKGESFLEVGPGDLGLALDLISKFTTGTLIDFNTTDVKQIYDKLPSSYKQKLTLIISDFSQYNQFESKFDCVVACEVLEHIENDRLFLRRTTDFLQEGGQLILSVPARQKYWAVDDVIVGHYRRYEKLELYEKLTEAGYSQINIISYGFPFQNLIRLSRIALARSQYKEKGNWEKKKQSQQSAFMVKRKSYINLIGFFLNKYTLYPFCVIASLFNKMDLAEGYVVSATKPLIPLEKSDD
jgi:ubiquinone/menaquinone biosynthesis C-methylase UbiE